MKTDARTATLLASIIEDGFDLSYPAGLAVRAKCSQCEALVINGLATHEHGCPNIVRDVTCHHCGDEFRSNESHECEPSFVCVTCNTAYTGGFDAYTCSFECHRSDDPHCTCNDCIEFFARNDKAMSDDDTADDDSQETV